MFTGIVETLGTVRSIVNQQDCRKFSIQPAQELNDLAIGDSISVNGVCLTVEQITAREFTVTSVPETLRLTNLFALVEQSIVNLERGMIAGARVGGHYVQGHVDGIGEIIDLQHDGAAALMLKIGLAKNLANYIIKKGFIALDGMSLTVVDVDQQWCSITLIPHTLANTIAHKYHIGSLVNIEVDMMAKYIEKFLDLRHAN